MTKGLLIYTPEDYEKNKWFAQEIISEGLSYDLEIHLVLTHQLALQIDSTSFSCSSPLASDLFKNLSFVINRSRDSLIGAHFEKMGCKVFNNSQVTEICNHKGKTHQLVNSHGISSVPTLLGNRKYFSPNLCLSYPAILKSINGHGGREVFWIKGEKSLTEHLKKLPTDEFILQQPCTKPGIDIRVFALGQTIVAAVKRCHPYDFKSNYSLGGTATAYTLTSSEKQLVQSILSLLAFDFVGIDFILDEENQLLFNEIEDVVGTRTLYLNYPELNIVRLYLDYISHQI